MECGGGVWMCGEWRWRVDVECGCGVWKWGVEDGC